MPSFEVWDVVKVPFPYTDRPVRQHRPALVVAAGALESDHGLLWVLMITSAENRGWRDDVAVSDRAVAGLPAPSVVRCAKIATIEARDAQRIGHLPSADRAKIAGRLRQRLSAIGTLRTAGPRRALRHYDGDIIIRHPSARRRKDALAAAEEIIAESSRDPRDRMAIRARIDKSRRG
jgi:mRNA interferase MazF